MKSLVIGLWISLAAAPGLAQSKKAAARPMPDFSGTWLLDRAKSKFERGGRGSAYVSSELVISHRDPELKVTRKFVRDGGEKSEELTYYTDGRGETNRPGFGIRELKTRTKWDGIKLTSKWNWSYDIGNDALFTDGSERRELSVHRGLLVLLATVTAA